MKRRMRDPHMVRIAAVAAAAVFVSANAYLATAGPVGIGPVVALGTAIALGSVGVLGSSRWIRSNVAIRPRRVLAVGAHPDDLELGCGATMAKLADAGHEVRALVMTSGEQGGSGAVRLAEARTGGRFMGVAALYTRDFPDTRLAECELEMVSAIEDMMRRFNPVIILTHSANDQHQDHRAVHIATLRAGRSHASILCFESPSATAAFSPSVFVDIEDYVEVKTAAVAAHRDQRGKPYMAAERIRGLPRGSGLRGVADHLARSGLGRRRGASA